MLQVMNYTTEVDRDNQKVETHFGIYDLYAMLFAQLMVGPMVR